MMALARKIVGGEEEDAQTIEAVFAAAREDAEASAEELLVDEGWKTHEVETGEVEELKVVVSIKREGHHRRAAHLVGPARRVIRRHRPVRAHRPSRCGVLPRILISGAFLR